MEIQFSLADIESVANKVRGLNLQKVVLFNGAMGAGKTTFIKAFAKSLGVKDTTGSPTFSLVNEYKTTDNQTIYHFDVYRLKSEVEAYDMGMEEYLYSGHYCFIEWAEKIPSLIPDEFSAITLTILANGDRLLEIK